VVVSLGCGFDTRYWRIPDRALIYIEIDLPEVIAAKREVLGRSTPYEMIGCSVLEKEWIENIAARKYERVLFLAEGLFMYLEENKAVGLFKVLAEEFSNSMIVFEIEEIESYSENIRVLDEWSYFEDPDIMC
jgi:O-methyltransferase involved in polyketide biosynthesis